MTLSEGSGTRWGDAAREAPPRTHLGGSAAAGKNAPGMGAPAVRGHHHPPAGPQHLAAKLPAAKKSRVGETQPQAAFRDPTLGSPGVPACRPRGPLPTGSTSPRSHRILPTRAPSAACTGQGGSAKTTACSPAHRTAAARPHRTAVMVLTAGSGSPSWVPVLVRGSALPPAPCRHPAGECLGWHHQKEHLTAHEPFFSLWFFQLVYRLCRASRAVIA